MQDRFKFRVWLKDTNKMYNVHSLHIGTNKVIISSRRGNVSIYINKNSIIMQSTGLKDKNGKLIYEDDIVTYDDRDIYPYHTPILNAIIEMRKYQWCMVYYRKDIINANTGKPAEQKTWLGFDDFITSRIEVIGNIYESPELLEVENE